MVVTEVLQKINLVDGQFTPSEASDVINALIKEKINFHKLQRLCVTEHCETSDTGHLDGRIGELTRERETAARFIKEARSAGKKITISGTLELSFED